MSTIAKSRVSAEVNVRTIAALVFLLGAGLVFLTGFAPSTTLHNAAHDSRHSMSFPCH